VSAPDPYLFFFIGCSQQMRWAPSAQQQALSTVTARPQTSQLYLLPSVTRVVFFTAFLTAVFLDTAFTPAFLGDAFPDVFTLAMSFPFLL